jgi:hypothetical protein
MSFQCPKCKKTSHHPEDERHGYCGNCHEFTGPPVGTLPNAGDTHVFVDGIVSARNHEPFVRLMVNGEKAQLSIAETFKIANDLIRTAARTEADAGLLKFFTEEIKAPPEAGAGMMHMFRSFRQQQDDKVVERAITDPDSGETIR